MRTHSSSSRATEHSLTPLDYAYRLLAQRSYSEVQLGEKLLGKGFTDAAVDRTVARLKEQGYLNDARLAADQAAQLRRRGFGPARIRAKLDRQGIDSSLVAEVLTATAEESDLAEAQRLLASRFPADTLKQPKIAARAFRWLLSRGYSQETAEQLLGSGLDGTGHPEEE